MKRTTRSGTFRPAVLVLVFWLASIPTSADEVDARVEGAAAAARKASDPELPIQNPSGPEGDSFDLEPLLHLPSGFVTTQTQSVAGASESEWRRRFATAVEELSEAHAKLTVTKRELDGLAKGGGSSQWAIAPPGGSASEVGPSTSPLSFKLRQQLRSDRERIEDREKALRDLRIEADLAGVPQGWRAVASPAPSSVEADAK